MCTVIYTYTIKNSDSLASLSVHLRQTWRNTGPNSRLQLPTVLSHSKVTKPVAFSAFVFSFRQTHISRDLDIRFLTPLLRSLQTEIYVQQMPEMQVLPVCPQLLVWGKDRLPLTFQKESVFTSFSWQCESSSNSAMHLFSSLCAISIHHLLDTTRPDTSCCDVTAGGRAYSLTVTAARLLLGFMLL